jgi:8-oxo-dGTP diphosphatase
MSEHLTNIVVCALIERDGKLFVAKRADTKSSWPGRYEIIGGHLDPGESLEEGLRREIREEVGADIEIGQLVDAFTYTSQDEQIFKVEVCYLCRFPKGVEPTLNPDDHSEFRWITEDELPSIEKEDEETRALKKAFTILKGENQ